MFKDRRRVAIIAGIGVIFVCLVCGVIYVLTPPSDDGGDEVAQVTTAPTEIATEVTSPEETPFPTEPPESTEVPPTELPPEPTATETEPPLPTHLPDPIVLTGSGDSVVDFENPFPVGIAHIIGNAASSYFGVTSYDVGGEMVDLLINTTEPYDGIVLLDVFDTQTTRFEIQAVGDWTIVVDSIFTARKLEVPGALEGKGDEVIFLTGATPDLANIKGNEQSSYFGVMSYGNYGDLLVNSTDPYEGTVPMEPDSVILEFEAVGSWSIEVTAK